MVGKMVIWTVGYSEKWLYEQLVIGNDWLYEQLVIGNEWLYESLVKMLLYMYAVSDCVLNCCYTCHSGPHNWVKMMMMLMLLLLLVVMMTMSPIGLTWNKDKKNYQRCMTCNSRKIHTIFN